MLPTWIVETELNAAAERVAEAARVHGCRVLRWSTGEARPTPPSGPCVFLGSLTACAGMPGVIGDPERLRVRHWLPLVGALALNRESVFSTVGEVARLELPWARVFVRPDSAMKPFAGRVMARGQLGPAALDHGFYYDDLELPVVIAPARPVAAEWRFVIVGRRVVTACGYAADGRAGRAVTPPADAYALAERAAAVSPEESVVADVCRLEDGRLFLVEFNLLSGADLYECDADAVVSALSRA